MMRLTLNLLFALGLALLIGIEFYPQLGSTFHRSPSPLHLQNHYPEETIHTLLDHGFGSSDAPGGSVIRKWRDDIRVKVYGDPKNIDTQFLQATVEQLASLIGPTRISLLGEEQKHANFHIHIIPRNRFTQVLPQYGKNRHRPTFSWCHWNGNSEMNKATLLIDSGLEAATRHNQILRLLVRNLGLIGFTIEKGNSVFTDTTRTNYSLLDREIIQLLYEDLIVSGMTKEQARRQLESAGAIPPESSSE